VPIQSRWRSATRPPTRSPTPRWPLRVHDAIEAAATGQFIVTDDLIDQLFNASEKRLARALLLLARYGKQDKPRQVVPSISQETLSEMVGTTRSRINLFMNKFKRLGFIEYNGDLKTGIQINNSLLSVVLHD
jgi:CRP/FNR family transcriptional regulator, cyclic AMP receptor protein